MHGLYILISCFLILFGSKHTSGLEWSEGDILFQDGDCGDFCEAIRKVTVGYQGRDFSHNGILTNENGEWYVLEAISKGVSKTPLEDFLNRDMDVNGNPKIIVGRLKAKYRHLIQDALVHASSLEGKPYDAYFDLNNDAYYCSELIHLSLQKANEGIPVFQIYPMTFMDPDTMEPFDIWVTYFNKLGIDIPENEPGLNPGGMSTDPALTIIYDFTKR
ncbi:YiiX/YebB-like N1pC/P60 family cysteine hydrolase [Anditalea andensis]|uniref:Permuted papain-like amidase enzyme, YaeF/YiiX, C92 family n=1 Tax=Anditalea andensis TaxID=1048983 RepID=A0A074KZU5_9BACT|nr:YiiX/YebB-like N1pC/P60 family cysteine hydrolase [Anditalea andensis]KEO74459.1 hypothetical protein EL17_06900 [Anditalea andensis]